MLQQKGAKFLYICLNNSVQYTIFKVSCALNKKQGHLYAVCCIINIINLGNKTPRLYRCRSCFSTARNEFVVLPTLSFRHWGDMNEASDSRITLFVQDNTGIGSFKQLSKNQRNVAWFFFFFFSWSEGNQIKLKSSRVDWNEVLYP